MSEINPEIHRKMIELSNNSPLTRDAATILSKLSPEDQVKIKHWLGHATFEVDNRLTRVLRNSR